MAVHILGSTPGVRRPCDVYFHFVDFCEFLGGDTFSFWEMFGPTPLHDSAYDKQGCTLHGKTRDRPTFVSTHGKRPYEI